MQASCNPRKETTQLTTVTSHSQPDQDQTFVASTSFLLSPPNSLSRSVNGIDRSPHIWNRHLKHHHPQHMETKKFNRVSDSNW